MIDAVRIQNFKSIRQLSFTPKRINLFIGEPNTGKSNVLEALAFFAQEALSRFSEIFRFKTVSDLFFDQKVSEELNVRAGEWEFALKFTGTMFQGSFFQNPNEQTKIPKGQFQIGHTAAGSIPRITTPFRYFRFKPLDGFPNGNPSPLNPPYGDNLVAVLYANETLRRRVSDLIRSKGFRLQIKPADNELLIAKEVGDELYSYPWRSFSETLRRVIFYMALLETNKGQILLLDEPEAQTFPFYTKQLAERFALDETNQFFITTHNPYLLSSVVSKARPEEVAVFVTRMEKFETKVIPIPKERFPELLEFDADVFFNLEKLVAA